MFGSKKKEKTLFDVMDECDEWTRGSRRRNRDREEEIERLDRQANDLRRAKKTRWWTREED